MNWYKIAIKQDAVYNFYALQNLTQEDFEQRPDFLFELIDLMNYLRDYYLQTLVPQILSELRHASKFASVSDIYPMATDDREEDVYSILIKPMLKNYGIGTRYEGDSWEILEESIHDGPQMRMPDKHEWTGDYQGRDIYGRPLSIVTSPPPSYESADYEKALEQTKKHRERIPGLFKSYSFDVLPYKKDYNWKQVDLIDLERAWHYFYDAALFMPGTGYGGEPWAKITEWTIKLIQLGELSYPTQITEYFMDKLRQFIITIDTIHSLQHNSNIVLVDLPNKEREWLNIVLEQLKHAPNANFAIQQSNNPELKRYYQQKQPIDQPVNMHAAYQNVLNKRFWHSIIKYIDTTNDMDFFKYIIGTNPNYDYHEPRNDAYPQAESDKAQFQAIIHSTEERLANFSLNDRIMHMSESMSTFKDKPQFMDEYIKALNIYPLSLESMVSITNNLLRLNQIQQIQSYYSIDQLTRWAELVDTSTAQGKHLYDQIIATIEWDSLTEEQQHQINIERLKSHDNSSLLSSIKPKPKNPKMTNQEYNQFGE